MIHGSSVRVESASWQNLLAGSITDPRVLLARLKLDPGLLAGALAAGREFALRVPEPYLLRMQPGNPNDPLLRQVLPLGEELEDQPGYVTDPLGEQHSNAQPGIIHKYHGRLLLVVTAGCAINCRYCFRRHFPYAENNLSTAEWEQALDYIRQDSSINEVIYSGGDPLAANDRRIAWLTRQIADIPHIKRLRVHTRLPVVIPQRVTDGLIEALSATRLPVTMVLHCNHANEVDAQMLAATQKLKSANITLLNQAVLLRGVNNRLEDQMALSEVLGDNGVLPYYLHLLDHVRGASHFHCSDAEAKHLVGQLLTRLPGYLVPRLVREIAGEAGKVPIHVDLITS
ncbi:EF-P beta-lysylation protein EpmB [Pseudomonas neustonica]|uniref:L-lysine 2,3-aminomutase n=1 Tax=Pseudomonas neustonica TaxID=2487346 RepID=A0ABX9XMG6_9PSED|nr:MULTISPECIES: EF-P beta-lysylation protein EpmB [Pseudomonas]MAB25661.1 EF-P beta-lysylation protein EpmB [Pseudomonadales bacterium]MBA6419712.1 EF-P beta-lysylation protein EpmB [Pseudomonas sp. 5Ae-yellow]ROZ87182.1 EF-P beta-lysylation protein EpmB [Pseudomonas sp. SSM44]ROZ88201.1 EF-P beta-lysylation protein EpmB [Pseudomonas neustonica]|tara:strand:+ start:881 stop:1906 length:1026 start_codon:yes stop_codon:yes gene_type:complete